MDEILSQFDFDSPAVSCRRLGEGHINKSYCVTAESGQKYILQRVNGYVFRDAEGLMNNAVRISRHLREKGCAPGTYLNYVMTKSGKTYIMAEDGQDYWRSYVFIDGTVCLQAPESTEDFYQSAVAFGSFQTLLQDFPADSLAVTIPAFHDTPERLKAFRRSIEENRSGRAAEAQPEIEFLLARADFAPYLMDKLRSGELPVRVTHNDTKLNNVLLDKVTRKPRCIIDLDTVMPGLTAWDFGDAIRFGACTAEEDEPRPERVQLDMEMYRAFTKGFIRSCPALTRAERAALPYGAKMMCYENAIRFLADFLDGDVYFSTSYPEHNLVRTRVQIRMLSEIEKHWDEMLAVVEAESGEKLFGTND